MKLIKYLTIPFITLGIILSLVFGVEYNCKGEEMFPIYYGSPFVFKQKSLGSSMEYFYSISGLLLNVAVWSLLIYFIKLLTLKLIKKTVNNKILMTVYKGVTVLLIMFSTINILIDSMTAGKGFKEGLNYWYMDFDKEVKDWEMECSGTLTILKKENYNQTK